MRELYRTDEGAAAWRLTTTDAEARRLLGGLVQPQPERQVRMVLGNDGVILMESLIRRGWVAWRDVAPIAVDTSTPAPASPSVAVPPAVSTPVSAPPASKIKPAPEVSKEEINSSLDHFFRVMGGG